MSSVKQGQNFLDKVLAQTGSIDNAMDMALINEMSITHIVVIGDVLLTGGKIEPRVVSFFNHEEPATCGDINYFGIGTMQIENTFIVA